jgi:hypothetical protein
MAEQKFTSQQALGILIQGIRIAQSKGAFTLEDAEVLSQAVKLFQPEQPAVPAPAPDQASEKPAEQIPADAVVETPVAPAAK